MKPTTHHKRVSVPLTERQYKALQSFTNAVDATMAGYLRSLVTQNVPTEYWEAAPPPHPDQMKLEGVQDDASAARPS